MGNHKAEAAHPLIFWREYKIPPDEKKGGMSMYVTYSDLIQTGIFIVALVGLCYQIFKDRK